ncbi:Ubiquitin--protein ligase [Handroanthus impetiginosus]|uniref:U-box domain-containing protein n=1 Tax=Handroanthus impetiginosus TaxID=429701 RepID=A0A2G9FZI3_9LAMI|nr:Ubiquitin--protein ligase [Handroanthus impetiginosus]
MEDSTEVPKYFICPISLEIMKDPVTTVSGITYDRESIEHWLYKSNNMICPVTKQPLPRDSDLIPNHTLRRLIKAWCAGNAANGIEPIPSPKPPLSRFYVINLIRDLSFPNLQMKTLQKLEALALENERNRILMVEAGLGKGLISFITSCYEKRETNGLEEALSLFHLVRTPLGKSRGPLTESNEIIESLMWVFGCDRLHDNVVIKSQAAYALRVIIQKANPGMLESLKPDFFKNMLSHIGELGNTCRKGLNSLLCVLLDACPWGRNRVWMVESGAVVDLIEVEIRSPEKKTTELVLGILYHLCSCADARAQLLSHTAGIAVLTRPILKVSSMADDRALSIIWLISKYCGTNEVVEEMLRVGTVAKLCMVMQENCAPHLKENAREILMTHSDVWNDSLSLDVSTLTR